MSSYSVMPLTCSTLDAMWYLPLPQVFDPDIQKVSIGMRIESGDDSLFHYDEDSQKVFLNMRKRDEYLAGELCPEQPSVTLTFDLQSDSRDPST